MLKCPAKKRIILSFIICLLPIFISGQARRVANYSESSPDNNFAEVKKPAAKKNISSNDEVIRVETDLVVVSTNISSGKGQRIADLRKEEFKIFEDGIEQELVYFSNEEQPFTVAVVLDTSYSSVFKLKEIQNAALVFINQLRENDKVTIISFDEKVRVLCEPTSDRNILRLAVEGAKIASGTSLYSALSLTLNKKNSSITGRKAVIILGDGVDTTSRDATIQTVLRDVSADDVLVYPIQYDTYYDVQESRRKNAPIFYDEEDRPIPLAAPKIVGEREDDYLQAKDFLKNVAETSGGRVYRVSSTTNLNKAFADIADQLRKIYSLGYYPSNERIDGGRYRINVRVFRPNLKVQARKDYIWKRR